MARGMPRNHRLVAYGCRGPWAVVIGQGVRRGGNRRATQVMHTKPQRRLQRSPRRHAALSPTPADERARSPDRQPVLSAGASYTGWLSDLSWSSAVTTATGSGRARSAVTHARRGDHRANRLGNEPVTRPGVPRPAAATGMPTMRRFAPVPVPMTSYRSEQRGVKNRRMDCRLSRCT